MPALDADLLCRVLYRLANLVLAASALGIAALIVARDPAGARSRGSEPLGLVFALVFLAIGLRAAVRVWAPASVRGEVTALIVVDWLAAAATVTFLLLRRRYGVFIETRRPRARVRDRVRAEGPRGARAGPGQRGAAAARSS